jgi:hypothetical protein
VHHRYEEIPETLSDCALSPRSSRIQYKNRVKERKVYWHSETSISQSKEDGGHGEEDGVCGMRYETETMVMRAQLHMPSACNHEPSSELWGRRNVHKAWLREKQICHSRRGGCLAPRMTTAFVEGKSDWC